MKFEKIEGHTRAMGEHQPEYETLYIRDDVQPYDFGGNIGSCPVNFMRFAVSLSAEECARLAAGEQLFVSIMGTAFQPFQMQVGDPYPLDARALGEAEPQGSA